MSLATPPFLWAAAALSVVGLLYLMWWRRRLGPYLVRASTEGSPNISHISLPALTRAEVFSPVSLFRAAQRMRRRTTIQFSEVDVPGTVEITIARQLPA